MTPTTRHSLPGTPAHLAALIAVLVALASQTTHAADAPTRPIPEEPAIVERLAGTILELVPEAVWDRALIRISGPDGYSLTERLPAGEPITVDLLARAEQRIATDATPAPRSRGESPAALPDGRYVWELELVDAAGDRRTHAGVFFVESGTLVSRQTLRGRLGAIAGELAAARTATDADPTLAPAAAEADYLTITDLANDGITYLNLDSDSPSNLYWRVANIQGDLRLVEDDDNSPPGTLRLALLRGNGFMGLGTAAPTGFLHIVTDSGTDMRIESSIGGERFDVNNDGSNRLRFSSNTTSDILSLHATEGIGVGVATPEADFHLANVDGVGDTVFKIARAGSGSWNLGHTATGVFSFSRTGTGGQEFTVRDRNDPVATLDVQGHVRGTSFKPLSSRALKTGFEAVDPAAILTRLGQLPVTTWSYRSDPEKERHIGPVAEDFQRLFGLGDGRSIATVDADGVLIAALQALTRELEEVSARLERQAGALRDSDAEVERLRYRLAALEATDTERRP
jgi:hypothetical protein